MIKLVKKTIAIVIYLIIFFFSGYWVGKNPDFYKETIALGRSLPKIFIQNHSTPFQQELLDKLKDSSHVDFEIITEQPESADLWITHISFLKNVTDFNLKFHKLQNKAISPDFQLSELKPTFSLPIVWKIENQKLSIITLTAPIQNRAKQSKLVQMLVQSLLSKDFQLILIQSTDWNTPLLTLDELNIPPERKASFIRKNSLLKTKIEQ